jgi:glycosyltransferase involved in cell wall biosynthesis
MPITNFVFRRADGVIVHGTKHARYFQHDLGIRKDKVFVSGNASSVPIPENWQATAEHLVETHHLRGKLVILYVGGLIKRKGVDLLMQAFARLHSRYGDTFLIIVGEGPEKDHLVDLSMKFGLESSVSFEGWVDHDNIAPYYAVAGLVVLPSALRVDKRNPYEPVGEPWGLVVNEAMMMAKPVITTNAAGCADDLVINGQNGFVVRQGDAHALLDALSEFIRNPESIRKMGESSRMMTHEFTYAHMARAFVKAVRQDYNEDRLQSN